MPDLTVEEARMAFVSHIARLTLTNEGGGIDGPAVHAYRALEAAIAARATAPLVEALEKAEKVVARFVKARDAFHYDYFGGEVERHLERAMEDAYGFLHGLPDDLRATLKEVEAR